MLKSLRSQRGFTLIETLAALLIFSLVTLGVVPLIIGSVRGATVSRSYTVARNLAQQAMERVRGLPYHIAFNTQAQRVDILDLYYPAARTSGTYQTICDSTTGANPACPRNIVAGYRITFNAAFVSPDDPASVLRAGTHYDPSYTWGTAGRDAPPSQLLRMDITATWDVFGTPRRFQLQSLISDRRFGDLKFTGTATVDHVVSVNASFTDTTGNQADLLAVMGAGESNIESKLQSAAEQSVTAGTMSLLAPDGTNLAGSPVTGAVQNVRVPPSGNVGEPGEPSGDVINVAPDPSSTLAHGGRLVAGMENTSAINVKARVAAELPNAQGTFTYATPTASALDFWVAEQGGTENPALGLDPDARMLEIRESDDSGDGLIQPNETLFGTTSTFATSLASASPRTHAEAVASLEDLRLFPSSRISAINPTFGGAVVAITDFDSRVECTSTGTLSAEAEVTWTANVHFWQFDTDGDDDGDEDEDEAPDGEYVMVPVSGAVGTDPLGAFSQATNPLVWEAPESDPAGTDVYLFEDPTQGRLGYLQRWSSSFDVSTSGENIEGGGEETTARISSAITIETASPGTDTGPLLVQVGSLSCRALEFRL